MSIRYSVIADSHWGFRRSLYRVKSPHFEQLKFPYLLENRAPGFGPMQLKETPQWTHTTRNVEVLSWLYSESPNPTRAPNRVSGLLYPWIMQPS